ncbi:hypothetical protein DL764_000741 [Monosporascus ibericus]|uniref:GED domain-containing protein n=1 Tax=Monosporascus ibericus TaxID=155417 RepID=A0A4V1XCM3_9PEZI|nr:hypothetical protein DL764_000741 [Monosporascus ibericus]
MGSMGSNEPHTSGNHSILTKVDRLRELIGTRVSLPQLVVVGDQSSGKSSVLEGLTGFAFPRAAELCTRYATQITCRRETEESITVSIIPSNDAHPHEQERVKLFHRTLTELSPDGLAELFRDANEAMGIRTPSRATSADGSTLPAFSEHMLKIEKLGPNEEHFTVIDVPGIFRQETAGVTEESDITLVKNMVEKYMKDSRTIILAIIPCNADPATQEILKLAKKADPAMSRTMAVLTKPDLAPERAMQQIAIDHVSGNRGDLTLGYYIVKNRGSDETDMTLQQGLARERAFFGSAPWSTLNHTRRAGMDSLKVRVRELLIDLIKREFPKLRADVYREVATLRANRDKMGPSRSNQHTQRAYINKISERFQTLARDALNAYYTGDKVFARREDLRLITRVVHANERFNEIIEKHGHSWQFAVNPDAPASKPPKDRLPKEDSLDDFLDLTSTTSRLGKLKEPKFGDSSPEMDYPELGDILDFNTDITDPNTPGRNIMDYIEDLYKGSRGQELGTFGGSLLATMFKDQSAKWEPITLTFVGQVILMVHHFIVETINEVCPDTRVREQLWESFLLEELQRSYTRALDHTRFLLDIEREGTPLTLNHYFNDSLQTGQGKRLVQALKNLAVDEPQEESDKGRDGVFLLWSQLKNLSVNKANSEHVREYMHDVLKSYYKVSRKRFVDVVVQQAVGHFLLRGPDSPLRIFTTDMVLGLNDEQLEMIAAEDAPVRLYREKLDHDIEKFEGALKVLKGSSARNAFGNGSFVWRIFKPLVASSTCHSERHLELFQVALEKQLATILSVISRIIINPRGTMAGTSTLHDGDAGIPTSTPAAARNLRPALDQPEKVAFERTPKRDAQALVSKEVSKSTVTWETRRTDEPFVMRPVTVTLMTYEQRVESRARWSGGGGRAMMTTRTSSGTPSPFDSRLDAKLEDTLPENSEDEDERVRIPERHLEESDSEEASGSSRGADEAPRPPLLPRRRRSRRDPPRKYRNHSSSDADAGKSGGDGKGGLY